MGPRWNHHGYALPCSHAWRSLHELSLLQWGRGEITADTMAIGPWRLPGTGFNGAAVDSPRIQAASRLCRFTRLQWGRGGFTTDTRIPTSYCERATLQWGRGEITTDTRISRAADLERHCASMGPRWIHHGYLPSVRVIAPCRSLQWGRGGITTDTHSESATIASP